MQLESEVAELNDRLSSRQQAGGGNTPDRPTNFQPSDCANHPPLFNRGLEPILDSIKEDISHEVSRKSNSPDIPEKESSSLSCTPILPRLKSHASVPSICSGVSNEGAKYPPNLRPPLLTTSASFNQKLSSISRLQEEEIRSSTSWNGSIDSGVLFNSETSSGVSNEGAKYPPNLRPPQLTTSASFNQKLSSISRLQEEEIRSSTSWNGSIDSGVLFNSETSSVIQFPSETDSGIHSIQSFSKAENSSTHGKMEPMSEEVEPVASSSTLTKSSDDDISFADAIFAALGMK